MRTLLGTGVRIGVIAGSEEETDGGTCDVG